jgi:SAM-dependent methyltransferase
VLLDVGTGTGGHAIAAARICKQVIGIDVRRESLKEARSEATKAGLTNIVFAHGSFQRPSEELDLSFYGITKILAVYSLHHLRDPEKKESLNILASLLHRPGSIVIGDLMFFADPEEHRQDFDKISYDDGETDFPSRAEYLVNCLEELGAKVTAEQTHALVGVILAEFP